MANFTIEGVMTDAAKELNNRHNQYGNFRSYYKKAAFNASHKLNREVTEYEVLMHELAVLETRIAINRTDYASYVGSVLLTSLGAQFSTPSIGKHFESILRTEMEEAVREAVSPPVNLVPEMEQVAHPEQQ